MSLVWDAAGASDIGLVRDGNEDAFAVDPDRGIFLVADGMGGHAAGEVASALVAEVVKERLTAALDRGVSGADLRPALRDAAVSAHAAILDCCRERPETRGMGSTLTAAVIHPAGALHAVHVGDSRLYLFGPRGPRQLTTDHTWVQREVEAGRITPEAARNHRLSHILTHVLTDDVEPALDLVSIDVLPGDVLLLSTDGLHNMLSDPVIAGIVTAARPARERVRTLLAEANRAGGSDNVTAVLVAVGTAG